MNQPPNPVVVRTPPLPGFTTTLFVQADPGEYAAVAPLLDASGVGVVYTQNSTTRPWHNAAGPAQATLRRSTDRNVMLDAGQYAGTKRRMAEHGIDESWIRFQQRDLGLPWAMADSGYCARGDLAGVETILHACEKTSGNVIVPLPVSKYLLIEDADKVRGLIEKQDRPVALIVEDAADPFGAVGVAAGLVHLIAGGAPVGLLRADTSALGALAFGAPFAAIGTRPGLRHIPVGGGPVEVKVSMLVPTLLSYKYTEHVLEAYSADPSLPEWSCDCHVCDHQRHVGWIPVLTDPTIEALRHSIGSVACIARELGMHVDTATIWCAACADAQAAHFVVGDGSKVWKPKPFLRRWAELTPVRVGA